MRLQRSMAVAVANRQAACAQSLVIATFALAAGGGLQHVITCCNEGRWGLLVSGLVLTPLGIVHGLLAFLALF